MKRKAGRPKKAMEDSKAPGISIRLTKAEREQLDTAINASGLSQSDWARKSLLYIASNDIRIT
jgi:hypothetical protein